MKRQYGIVIGPEMYEKLIKDYEVWLSDNQDLIKPTLERWGNNELIRAYETWCAATGDTEVMVYVTETTNNLDTLPDWYVEFCGMMIDEYMVKAGGKYYHAGWANFLNENMAEFQGVWFEDVTTGSEISTINGYNNDTIPFFWFIPLDNQHTALVQSDGDIYESEEDVIAEVRTKLQPISVFSPSIYLRNYSNIICMTYLDKYPR